MKAEEIASFISESVEALRGQKQKSAIVAETIPSRLWARIGIDGDDVVLLFPRATTDTPDDLPMERLRVELNVDCKLSDGGRKRRETLVIVRLVQPNRAQLEAFAGVIGLLLSRMCDYEPRVLVEVITTLSELFRTLASATLKTIQGLYGELIVMRHSKNIELAAESWHASVTDKFDYGNGDCRVEVKTAQGPRQHFFLYEQLRPPGGRLKVVIASLVVETAKDGETVLELLDTILGRLKSEATKRRVFRLASKTLGPQLVLASGARFDGVAARQNLKFYAADDVPCVTVVPGVSEVKFRVDLQLTAEGQRKKLQRLGDLPRAVVA